MAQDNPQTIELLSAYIDNELSDADRFALEARLHVDPALRAELDELRQVVALVKSMPMLRAPRNYTLDPAQFGNLATGNQAPQTQSYTQPYQPPRKNIIRPNFVSGILLAGAASVVIGVVVVLLLISQLNGDDDTVIDQAADNSSAQTANGAGENNGTLGDEPLTADSADDDGIFPTSTPIPEVALGATATTVPLVVPETVSEGTDGDVAASRLQVSPTPFVQNDPLVGSGGADNDADASQESADDAQLMEPEVAQSAPEPNTNLASPDVDQSAGAGILSEEQFNDSAENRNASEGADTGFTTQDNAPMPDAPPANSALSAQVAPADEAAEQEETFDFAASEAENDGFTTQDESFTTEAIPPNAGGGIESLDTPEPLTDGESEVPSEESEIASVEEVPVPNPNQTRLVAILQRLLGDMLRFIRFPTP